MSLNEFLDTTLLRILEEHITIGEFLLALLLTAGAWILYRLTLKKGLPVFFSADEINLAEQRRDRRTAGMIFLLLLIGVLSLAIHLDPVLYEGFSYSFKTSTLLFIVAAFLLVRLADRSIARILVRNYELKQAAARHIAPHLTSSRPPKPPRHVAQPLLYLGILFVLLNMLDFDLSWTFASVESGLSRVLQAVFILFAARFFVWVFTELALFSYYQKKGMDIGAQYAVNQLLKYFIYTVALLWAMEVAGFRLTLLWGGAAALMVGLGLGLQQTFNDLVCGIILLFERAVEVGDVLDVDGMIGTVRKIGLRTSLVETRDSRTVILPNSKLIGEKVVNWSHDELKARFAVQVGVAYGSDTELVKKLLLAVAANNPNVIQDPVPFVRFTHFGESSLDFELHFWSRDFMRIEDVRSDMRFEIDRLFREHNVTIPFPQRDVWMR